MRVWTDQQVERTIGALLITSVILAAAVTLAGGVLFLVRSSATVPDYRVFRGEPSDLRSLRGIASDALALNPRGVIQLGLLLLLATPVARVALSLVAFAWGRDYTYVVFTLIVLAVLLYSLTGGRL